MSERGLLEAKNTLYKADRLSSTIIRSRIPIYKTAQQRTYLIMTEQIGKEVMEKTTEELKPGTSKKRMKKAAAVRKRLKRLTQVLLQMSYCRNMPVRCHLNFQ